MLIEFNAGYCNSLICNYVLDRVIVRVSGLCSGEQHAVRVHFHVICVVVFFKRYSKCVAAVIRNSCAVRGINRISVTVLCRSYRECITHPDCGKRHVGHYFVCREVPNLGIIRPALECLARNFG